MNNTYQVPCIYGQMRPGKKLTVAVPGSKSITNRALLLATLAKGTSRLEGALFSEDSRHFLSCIQELALAPRWRRASGGLPLWGREGPCPNQRPRSMWEAQGRQHGS